MTKSDKICRHMLWGLLPDNSLQIDLETHTRIRQAAEAPKPIWEVVRFTPRELENAVRRLKCGKAPGVGGIRSDIVKRLMTRIRLLLLDICLLYTSAVTIA